MRQPGAGTIRIDVQFRPDRLPWARWRWMVPVGLGMRIAQPLSAQPA